MPFPPIAIVGRGCVLPGALTPAALWDLVVSGGCALTRVPDGRWRVPAIDAVVPRHAPHDIGGYVTGFDEGPPSAAATVRWTLHAAGQALAEAGSSAPGPERSGLVLGWLGLPDEAMTYSVEQAWCTGRALGPDERRRHTSPATLCARELGFGAGSLALDAACASSLYAVKLACDRLHDGSADLMLAGGVSAADPLLIHAGFAALSALSPTGRSRPFHRDADGLVPAEGAALIALMRLADARSRGVPVLGVIRGIGLSNDGRSEGLLAPAESGQVSAMRAAYRCAGVAPDSVTLLECHATGTSRGDATEARSSARVFAGAPDLAVGAVKGNVGHAMTAAGAVGILKVLAAIESGVRPLTSGLDAPIGELHGSPLRVLPENQAWTGLRRCAVSAFGFGGNNAHVIIDAPELVSEDVASPRRRGPRGATVVGATASAAVAVVAVAARSAALSHTAAFTDALLSGGAAIAGLCASISVGLDGLRVPPEDLKAALARQVFIFEAAREATRSVRLPAESTQVVIATDCDPEIVRHTARVRADAAATGAPSLPEPAPVLDSAQVVGFLANMAANRVSFQLGLSGASFAVGADADAADAVALAVRAISTGSADAVIVGGVDVCCPSLGDTPGDAAAVLVLKRLDLARRDGDPVMAVLPEASTTVRGSTAADLLCSAADVLARYRRARPRVGATAVPLLDPPPVGAAGIDIACGWMAQDVPAWHVFSGSDRDAVIAALEDGRASRGGPARLVIVAAAGQLAERVAQARQWLAGHAPQPRFAAYRDRPLPGPVAAVFPGGAAAYAGMGAQLGLLFPEYVADLVQRCPQLVEVAGWVHDGSPRPSDTISCVWGAACFAHLHTAVTRDVLGVGITAALGYSSGETTALTALGAWRDLSGLVHDLRSSPLFTRELAGSYDAVPGRAWSTYLAARSAEAFSEAARAESAVYLMAVNSPNSCTFGGDPVACERVARRLGSDRVIALDYDLAVHAPVVEAVREQWYELHLRPTTPVPGVRFYGCAQAAVYELDDAAAAAANTAQAVGTLDFRGTIERAWADGVRVFIEHGPAGGCTEWIGQTLRGREHLAVSLDGPSASDVDNLANAVAALIAAGVPIDEERLAERFAAARAPERLPARLLRLDAHPPALRLPSARCVPSARSVPAVRSAAALEPLRAHHALVEARHVEFIRLLRERHAEFLAQREHISSLLARSEPGVLFDRADLEYLAVGAVSKLFGSAFAGQDGLVRQTRMPGPPMLLADRVLWIDAEPATMGTGVIRTQTDVRADSWFLDPCGRMPAGLMVEAGQADLLLISWLGADLLNRGERVYRLLGCEITYHGSPPHPGETLTFDIFIDEHAEHEGVRLFAFHYDCRVDGVPRLSVRNGQAGFFTDDELRSTRGVLWERPHIEFGDARRFGRDDVRAFGEGRFGDVGSHVRTPRPAGPGFLLFDEVDLFDPEAGYLRATLEVGPESWFFEGHFDADPCMPGTLMLEAAFQLMAFHLAASGHTATRDGWRFEPVPEHTTRISCRAQVTPESSGLSYELFVKRMSADPYPTLVADVLCSVDGVNAFLAEGLAVRLVPDWPLDQWRRLGGLDGHTEAVPAVFGLESLLACAWGRPSEMMGPVLAPMDDGRRVARLPGPPYHFVSRIVRLGERDLVAEYDVPLDAWFWAEGAGHASMPLCVALEVALQPCGWLALYTGDIANAGQELLFRNLGGQGTFANVGRDTRVLRTQVRLVEMSRTGDMIIDAFEVRVWADGHPVADLRSDFGFFPPAAFADQPGLAGPDWHADPASQPTTLPVPVPVSNHGPMLSLLDRITGYWPRQRRIRAEKEIAPDDWYFRAHFFQDPVQPGSLGLEAMLQLVQWWMTRSGIAAPDAVFEPCLDAGTVTWKYRGQVVPRDRRTVIEAEIVEAHPGYAVAEAWLSVNGRTIYHATGLGLRAYAAQPQQRIEDDATLEELFDPAVETWIFDHRPTWTAPALPMMSIVDRLVRAAGRPIAGLRDIRLTRWIVADRPIRLCGRVRGGIVELEHNGEVVASARIADESAEPAGRVDAHKPPAPLTDAAPAELPYARGAVFHGPAFHYLTGLTLGTNGASGELDAARGTVPRGRLHQGLLDATLHVIPHDELWRWSERIPPGRVGYPYRLPWMDFAGELPDSGGLRVEARFAGFDGDVEILPMFDVQVFGGRVRDGGGRLLLAYRLVEVLVPLGPLARLDSRERAAFLRDREYVAGAGLSGYEDGVTLLRAEDLQALDWFPGTVAGLYNARRDADESDLLAEVAVRDHVARRAGVHPSAVVPAVDLRSATVLGAREAAYRVVLERSDRAVQVRDEH